MRIYSIFFTIIFCYNSLFAIGADANDKSDSSDVTHGGSGVETAYYSIQGVLPVIKCFAELIICKKIHLCLCLA